MLIISAVPPDALLHIVVFVPFKFSLFVLAVCRGAPWLARTPHSFFTSTQNLHHVFQNITG